MENTNEITSLIEKQKISQKRMEYAFKKLAYLVEGLAPQGLIMSEIELLTSAVLQNVELLVKLHEIKTN